MAKIWAFNWYLGFGVRSERHGGKFRSYDWDVKGKKKYEEKKKVRFLTFLRAGPLSKKGNKQIYHFNVTIITFSLFALSRRFDAFVMIALLIIANVTFV